MPAEETFKKTLELEPDSAVACERLGYCYYRQNKLEEAHKLYLKSLEHDEKSATSHAGLGVVLMTMYLKDTSKMDLRAEAIKHWYRSLELDSNQPRIVKLIEKYKMTQTTQPAPLL